jgi:thiol:disulfide interchange protein DsbC
MTLIPTGRWLLAGFLALLSVLPVSAGAQEQLIRKAVAERFPNAKVESITKTPYPGLLEMVVDGSVFYTDEKFTFVIDGSLIETKTWSNITQARRDEIEARLQGPIAFRDLPLAQAVKTVRGNGRRVIATFEDPNCGFCRQFHGQLAKLNDVSHGVAARLACGALGLHDPQAVVLSQRLGVHGGKLGGHRNGKNRLVFVHVCP